MFKPKSETTYLILCKLAMDKHIPFGDYKIDVCW